MKITKTYGCGHIYSTIEPFQHIGLSCYSKSIDAAIEELFKVEVSNTIKI
jgi:hypothetical protein